MSLRTRLFLLLSLFALTAPVYSQPYPEAIEILRRYEQRPGVRVTALVRDLQTGEPVLAHRTSEAFRPASLVKIPTTGAFLALRGHDYRFHIPVMIRGQVDGETLHGDLVLKASADPSLGSHYIPNQKRLISEVKALLEERGITRITGRLIIDLRGFPRPFFNETWADEDLDEYYGAPISGFNIADNYADLYLFSSDGEQPVVEPNVASLLVPTRQELLLGSSTRLDLTPIRRADTLLISGTVREGLSGRHLRWTMPDPPSYATMWLNEGLRLEGIDLQALARATEGLTGADLSHLCDSAAERALMDSVRTGSPRMIAMADLHAALREIRPSTGPWFEIARNVVEYADPSGEYADLRAWMKRHRLL